MKDAEAKALQRALGGRYEVLGVLGRGAMGAVFRARDPGLNREVAIKTMQLGDDRVRLDRFKREAELTASLEHPGVVKVYSGGVAGGIPYLVTELVPGGQTLADVLPHKNLRQRVAFVRDVASALGYCHTQGVVHRDVKPQNVLIDGADQVRVADFGLASAEWLERLTQTGAAVGTPAYMPPEQIRGSRAEVSPASDVWALGVMLYEAVAGKVPFIASSYLPLSRKICEDPHPSLEGQADPNLLAVIDRALAKHPTQRYPDGAALAADLEAWLAGSPTSASHSRPAGTPPTWKPALRYAPAVLAVVLLLVVALWGGRAGPTPPPAETPTAESPTPSSTVDPAWAQGGERRWRRIERIEDAPERVAAIEDWLQRYAEHPLADAARALLRDERARIPVARLVHVPNTQVRACYWGERIVSWSDDDEGTVCLWETDGRELRRWRLGAPLYALVVTPEGVAVAGGESHELVVFPLDPRSSQPPRRAAWTEPGGRTLTLALHPDGRSLAVGGRSPLVKRFAIGLNGLGAQLAAFDGHVGEVHSLGFSPGGTELITISGHRADQAGLLPSEIRVYDELGGAPRARRSELWVGQALAFFPDGQRFVLGDSGGQLLILDLGLEARRRFVGVEVAQLLGGGMDTGELAHSGGVRGVALVQGGRRLYSVSGMLDKLDRNELRGWDAETGAELLTVRQQPGPYVSLAAAPDERHLAAGTTLGYVEVWALGE